ncbi:AcrR family transcriptional regulator [Arthrobacter sp. V4I6]|uniref:TetR/AcrR family transcriptional regulator n=1 Tax=unclassified Arthrobacter TaxID=235627 RepID=UPI0027816A56|nr:MULTISPECIES: TetR/AcrR family transcriptional regulator [unclassified Arthrobacter]MDQ0823635.1 AcrR family transcriptional regulator [Arthrobacter sp. V1I7]MDQ0853269.1 AcrR family transcriptional regulator [Arthrobacter sp. V4I6]
MPSEDRGSKSVRARAPRRDSLRNREALIEAARLAFAAEGLNASLDAIAASAGVGAGTLYRHFPSRSDLWGVVLVEPLNEQLHLAEEALRNPDKWKGLSGYIMASCALEADSRGYLNLMTTRLDESETLLALRRRIQVRVEELVREARDAGAVRSDFRAEDLVFVMLANSRIAEATRDVAPSAWRRNVELFLDGIRPDRATPLTEPPMKPSQVARTMMRPRLRDARRTERKADKVSEA